ncbi:MAG TPA: metallophosphoesterase [Anaerohalosphaeraceae bacterium]|nr:metallophosphoesterase [Anaerohalosphaeraceae bacterium]
MMRIRRREFLTAAVPALLGAGGCALSKSASQEKKSGRVLRFAHFTDIHMEPKRKAPEGLAKALRHMQSLEDRPSLLITGGDHVMDAFSAKPDWVTVQYETFRTVMREHCVIPVRYCIGNHDVWGWNKKDSQTTGQEPYWGKERPIHEFNLPGRYYAFSEGCWHFIILDSTHPSTDNYEARLDEEQFQWLQNQLQIHRHQYIVIVSHIPILSAAVFLDGDNVKDGHWSLPKEWMHLDAGRLKDLFKEHRNVKLCISGHLHLVDRVEYNGVVYICDGAVCASWWKGDYNEFDEGYGVFDLYEDGTFRHQYLSYGWTAAPDGEGGS